MTLVVHPPAPCPLPRILEPKVVNVLIATSEVVPFSKTGGLADVAGSLPRALAELGHRPAVITPAYRQIYRAGLPIERINVPFEVPVGNRPVPGRFLRSRLPGTDIPVFFVDQPEYFDRPQLYQERGRDYTDNCERFIFFCRAAIESIRLLGLSIDVLHCNDWQTGLLPAYLRVEYETLAAYRDMVALMTIHNMAYQGSFWHWDMVLTGLDWKYFNWRQLEHWGNLNLMKAGLTFADAITTVSRRYAEEIQSPPLGCGLEDILRSRASDLHGIVNGVDYGIWNPQIDRHLPMNYSVENWQEGKAHCKAELQREFGLAEAPSKPLIGFVGRLATQKGLDLIEPVMRDWVRHVDAQWVMLGTGEPQYHAVLASLAAEYPNKIAARIDFSDPLAHRIEAGADIFVMPSRYEPCGLNQLYSLKYGTVPVVRETGGLADTVCDANDEQLAAGTATGFVFSPYEPQDLRHALWRAVDTYVARPEQWKRIVETGMRQDWSWEASARQYVDLYSQLRDRRRGT